MSIFVTQEKKLVHLCFKKKLALVARQREKHKNILVNIEENRKRFQGLVYVSRQLKKNGNEKSSFPARA